jgi:hypothetical protein
LVSGFGLFPLEGHFIIDNPAGTFSFAGINTCPWITMTANQPLGYATIQSSNGRLIYDVFGILNTSYTSARLPVSFSSLENDYLYGDDWMLGITPSILHVNKYKVTNSGVTRLAVAAVATDTVLTVDSTGSPIAATGDYVTVQLNSGAVHNTTIASVQAGPPRLTLTAGIPTGEAAAIDNGISHYRLVAL